MYSPESHSHLASRVPVEPATEAPQLRVVRPESVQDLLARQAAESPSLGARFGGGSAHEVKFLLSEAAARAVEELLKRYLTLDPHAEAALGNGYLIRTLYCDTPEFHVFRRVGRFRRFKLRLRQYGTGETIFLERKAKQGSKVRKRRVAMPAEQLDCLAKPEPGLAWEGDWYHRQLLRNSLAPVCHVEYLRVAYFGLTAEGPLRLTFDREIRGGLTNGWSLAAPAQRGTLLPGQVVCEFKFRRSMPALFKTVIEHLQLVPGSCSKFRHCLRAAGIAASGGAQHA